ncbi:uncharacterized protein LOC128165013 [Crassostrea angulata]|uniref:uncharacterized protein LOC128165013 n=1 Tax=Magallana angulata TaxID=2784310 RepID=UPI0022B1B7C1|nr:uncharacterized protein LOC128165013 [Crassostrea angulata]
MPFKRYGVFLFTIVAVVLHGQDHNDPPVHCVSCHNVHDARVCPHLIQCDGECFERTEDQNGTRTKSYGCVKRKDCTASASIIGRRSSLSNTTTYCKKELCNKDIHHFIVPPTEPCVDISVGDCRDPAALAAICSDCELAQYCRKSCGLCQEHTGTTTWSENLVLFDYYPAHNQCNYSQAIGPSICHSIKAHGRAEQHAGYLNLPTYDSLVHVHFTTNGEPLTNLQLLSCQTTGKGRVDIILNNATIAEAYNETSVWAWDWTLHELNPAQHKGTHNYTLVIVKDRKVRSYGHYWLRNIRLETTVVHHGHN